MFHKLGFVGNADFVKYVLTLNFSVISVIGNHSLPVLMRSLTIFVVNTNFGVCNR